jgi:mannose-6-phosphate isomerase-like protein (cupin superfamily)
LLSESDINFKKYYPGIESGVETILFHFFIIKHLKSEITMKEIEIISEGSNHTALNIGDFQDLKDYSYVHPKLNVEIPGKVFIGEALQSSGTEISFSTLPSNTEIPFLHKHRKHEEIYIFLKGDGQFQVDGNNFRIKEGSVVRVSTEGMRSLRNDSEYPLTYICIQAQQESLTSKYVSDGYRVEGKIDWK